MKVHVVEKEDEKESTLENENTCFLLTTQTQKYCKLLQMKCELIKEDKVL